MSIVAGIDVSKASLDLYVSGHSEKLENTSSGHKRIGKLCRSKKADLVVMEATGSYHEEVAKYLVKIGLQVAVVNPARPHFFAKARGQRNKTDKVDAKLLSEYGLANPDLRLYVPPSQEQEQITELVRLREDLVLLASTVKSRRKESSGVGMSSAILKEQAEFYKKQIAKVEKEIRDLLSRSEGLGSKADLITSVPGCGDITSWVLLAEVKDFDRFEGSKQIAAFAGVCPSVRQSGTSLKSDGSMCKSGNRHVRKILYLAAMAAIRQEGPLKDFYVSLVARGKLPKQALVAVMHKLIRIVRAVVSSGCPYNAERALTIK
jgi:transposase